MNRYGRCRGAGLVRVALVSVLIAAACGPAPAPTPAVATPDPAAALMAAGAYSAAEEAYREAMLAAPESPEPALALADLYLAWSRPEWGLTVLAEATERGAQPDEVDRRQLALLSAVGRWEEARVLAEALLAANPASLDGLASLPEIHLQQHDCAGAVAAAGQHLDAYQAAASPPPAATLPDSVAESLRIWAVLSRGGDEEQLDALARQHLDPELAAALQLQTPERDLVVGLRLIRAGRWALAACVLTRAVEAEQAKPMSPDHAGQAHTWLGEALSRVGRTSEGERHLRLAIELDPESALAWLLLGQHYMSRDALERARPALLNAQRLDPMNPIPCLAVADLKAAMGRYDEVNTWVNAARVRAPGDPGIAKAAARFYLSRWLGNGSEAMDAAQTAVRLDPHDAEAHMLVGWALLNEERFAAAHEALAEAIALDPALAEAYHWQAVAFDRTGAGAEATAARVRAADLGYPDP